MHCFNNPPSNNLNNYLGNYFCNTKSRRINNIHFVGIGGAGMSGIAEVLYNLGFTVTGSDLAKNEATIRLANFGINIAYSHIAENVAYSDAVVASTAVPNDNIELVVARKRRIPIIHRSEMLAELMRFKYGIAVAGSHGKTTTTSLIATILAEANCDPTFVVGGKVNKFSANAKLGTGEFFVAESDESDGSFLYLNPLLAVVTNIDNDHLNNYGGDFNNLKKAFLEFIHRLPFYGLVVVCKDDPVICSVIENISRPLLSYGFSEQADVRAICYQQQQNVSKFQVLLPGESQPKDVVLNLPGKHNVLNALAAIAVAVELSIDFAIINKALMNFHGSGRRFQIHGDFSINANKFLLVDDYGHHPKEIEAVIASIREGWPERRLVVVFQPHRYSRTQQLLQEFIEVLAYADQIILLDIYSAGEAKIPNISSQILGELILENYGKKAILIAKDLSVNLEDLLLFELNKVVKDGDIILMQGAGDVGKLTAKLVEKLKQIVYERY
jgi:UDP-N-acetylmuramate--alanine ligase